MVIHVDYTNNTVFVPSSELGPPTPSPTCEGAPPRNQRGGGQHSPAREGWGAQFGRLEKKPGTLSTLWWYITCSHICILYISCCRFWNHRKVGITEIVSGMGKYILSLFDLFDAVWRLLYGIPVFLTLLRVYLTFFNSSSVILFRCTKFVWQAMPVADQRWLTIFCIICT